MFKRAWGCKVKVKPDFKTSFLNKFPETHFLPFRVKMLYSTDPPVLNLKFVVLVELYVYLCVHLHACKYDCI